MQKQLLLAAVDSTDHNSKTGGYVVYSTCSVTVEENEGVVQYVLRKRPNVKIVDTGLGNFGSEGFKSYMNKKFDDRMSLTRRYFPHRENVDGFFVCKLKKTGPTPQNAGQLNGGGKSDVVAAEVVNGSKPSANGLDHQDQDAAEDGFGGFNDDEDKVIIERAEKKWLKARGVDPKVADRKQGVKSKEDKRRSSKVKEKA
jgi:ribosomal RNA methyltransferase Nop2